MSNFFPNKPADAVLVDMINSYFRSNAQRADFTFGNPIVNDNPFVNTVMSVTVNSGPLVGRLSEIYYRRLDFDQLLSPRNVNVVDGSYTNVSDLLPLIKQNYNIDIQSSDITDSTIALATTEETAMQKTIRLVASANSLAYFGAGNVYINKVVVGNWMTSRNIDSDFTGTLFPIWEIGYPMTGFEVYLMEQDVPFGRQYRLGLGVSYNENYLLAGDDNTFEFTVATAESWALDVVAYAGESLPIHDLDAFPYLPFVKIILLNPQPGFENIQPLKFIHVPDFDRTGLRTWRVARQSYIPPAYEYNVGGEYVSRTRIVDENYQPSTNFGSVMDYFSAAIGNNGTHFNQANFEIQLGLENLSGVMLAVESTYVNVKHFLDQGSGGGGGGNNWYLTYVAYNNLGNVDPAAVDGNRNLMMKPSGVDVSSFAFQALVFTNDQAAFYGIFFRAVKGPGTTLDEFTPLTNGQEEYPIVLSSGDNDPVYDLVIMGDAFDADNSFRLTISSIRPGPSTGSSRLYVVMVVDVAGTNELRLVDVLNQSDYRDFHYVQWVDRATGIYRNAQLRLTEADLRDLLNFIPGQVNFLYQFDPVLDIDGTWYGRELNPSVQSQLNGGFTVRVTDNR